MLEEVSDVSVIVSCDGSGFLARRLGTDEVSKAGRKARGGE